MPGLPLVAALVLLACWPAPAQQAAANLKGVLSSGLYSTHNRDPLDRHITFVPLNVDMDLAGYLGAPGFLEFDLRPELTLGPQSTEAGFTGGNGVSLTTNFLSHRDFPLQLTYENLQREDVFFGSLTQLSGLRSLNHNRAFGINWQWRKVHWPHITYDMGNSFLTSEPILATLPGFDSRSRHQAVNIEDKRFGWNIEGILRHDFLASTLANPLESLNASTRIEQNISRYQATASRPLWPDSQLTLSGSILHNRNVFSGRPFDQDTRSASAGLNFGQAKKLQGGARVMYSNNVLGSAIQQAVSGLATGQPGDSVPPELLVLTPVARLTNLSDSGNVRYQVATDWALLGTARQDRVRAPLQVRTTPEADYLSGTGGVAFQHTYSWASVNAEYNRILGRSTYAHQRGRFGGQTFSGSGHRGSVDNLEFGVSYSRSDQRFVQVYPLTSKSQNGELTLGKRLPGLVVVHGGVGLLDSSFTTAASNYRAKGLTLRATAEHRLVQFTFARNTGSGNTVQGLIGNPQSNVFTTVLLEGTPLPVLLSSRVGQIWNVHSNPWRRLEVNYLHMRGLEILGGALVNRYAQSELRVGHRFRRLMLELGYVRYEQSFLTSFSYMRNRFYFRVSRSFEVF